jgi:hypothetical protein
VLPPVWGSVPGRNAAFTGRDAMVVRLRQGVQGSGRTLVQALYGAGGVGKTQLATEYAWRFAHDYDAVWWVNAEQTDRIGEQYATFAAAWRLVDPATRSARRSRRCAAQFLGLCAFLAPEPIPIRWFTGAGPGVISEPLATAAAAPFAFRRSLARLSRFGLAKLPDDDRLGWQACEAASYLLHRGELRAGHDMIASLHRAWRSRRGPDAWPTLWAATYLGRALWALGRPHDAIALERDRLAHFRKACGDDDPNTLAAAGNVAVLLAALG